MFVMSYKLHIYILYILVVALGLCLIIRVQPSINWTADTFIGVCVAMMAITMAIIIGYQAISAHEIKGEIKEQQLAISKLREDFEHFKSKLSDKQQEFEEGIIAGTQKMQSDIDSLVTHSDKILASTKESVSILNALILEISHNNQDITALDAFAKMHEALLYGLDYESENIDFIFNKLRQYGKNLTSLTFGGSFCYSNGLAYFCTPDLSGQSLRSVLDEKLLPPIKATEEKIRAHKLFSSISHDYSVLMNKFYERLDIITTRNFPKDLSELEKDF